MALLKETLVVKVDVKSVSDELHRFSFPKGSTLCFADLEKKICTRFGLSSLSNLRLTYKDNEGELVVMTDDDDLRDAVSLQVLNPLRLHVVTKGGEAPVNVEVEASPKIDADASPKVASSLNHQEEEPTTESGPIQLEVASALEQLFMAIKKKDNRAAECVSRVMQHLGDTGLRKSLMEDMLRFGNIPSVAASSALKAFRGKGASSSQAPASNSPPESKTVPVLTGHVEEFTESAMPAGKAATEKGQSSQQCEAGTSSGGAKQAQVNKGTATSTGLSQEDDGAAKVFHTRVQCDGCGMLPIVGPRFKSLVKHDYDLCDTCHNQVEDKDNYSRIDRPLFKPRHQPFWGPHRGRGNRLPSHPPGLFGGRPFHPAHAHRGPFGPPPGPTPFGPPAGPPPFCAPPPFFPCNQQQCCNADRSQDGLGNGKLDSRFVRDVSIFDGTELAPGTEFTKIWCLRNSGTIPWPQGTSLSHIGGDRVGDVTTVALPLPPSGLAVGEECEVAVDAVAPERPGRYVSHWRLVAPGGPKFGHRVWVLIQVVPKGELSPDEVALLADAPVKDGEVSGEEEVLAESNANASLPSEKDQPPVEDVKVEKLLVAETPVDSLPTAGGVEADDKRREGVFDTHDETIQVTAEVNTDVVKVASEADEDAADTKVDAGHQSSAEGYAEEESPIDLSPVEVLSQISVLQSPEVVTESQAVSEENSGEANIVPQSPTTTEDSTEDTSVGGFALLPYPAVITSAVDMDDMLALAASTETPVAAGEILKSNDDEAEEAVNVEKELEPEGMEVVEEEDFALEQLKMMGFADKALNVFLLARNGGDIMKTLDDLVAAGEWDPMLEELEEMGFVDVQTNRRLMFKHNGSVKYVVKELVEKYRIEAQQKKLV